MIQGKIPELTIKFSEKPNLPAEGKKVLVEIQGERNVNRSIAHAGVSPACLDLKVKAEVNRQTLKKQVAQMDEYEDWIGALSGKIPSINNGVIELEGADLHVFEKKKKEPKPE